MDQIHTLDNTYDNPIITSRFLCPNHSLPFSFGAALIGVFLASMSVETTHFPCLALIRARHPGFMEVRG